MLRKPIAAALAVTAVVIGCAGAHRPPSRAGAFAPHVWGPDKCPPSSSATSHGHDERGTPLGRIVVKDCEGRDVSLDRFCGADALWVFAAHGWCPHCQAVSAEAESIMASYADRNVAAVNVLVESPKGEAPTAEDCKAWARRFGLGRNVVPLYDPTGMALLGLWDGPTTALSVFVSKDRTIAGKTHLDDADILRAGIDVALARGAQR